MQVSHAVALTRRGAALWMLCGLAASAWAAAPADNGAGAVAAERGSEAWRDFDIPSQALAAALNRYGALVDQPAVFASSMVAGRVSTAVQGRYAAEAGLRLLLQGTGLSFEKISSGLGTTFLLKEDDRQVGHATLSAFFGLKNYPGLIQARIREVLCADPLTMPGRYDTLFRFRLDGDGRLHDAVLLDSTGSARRDQALLAALQQVELGPPPPAVLEQPLTMRLRGDRHAVAECAQSQPSLPSQEARP